MCCVGDDQRTEVTDTCDGKSSPGARPSFWRKFRPDDPALDGEAPARSSGWNCGGGGGRRVWLKVTKVFGRSESQRVPDVDAKQSTTLNHQRNDPQSSRHELEVGELVKSRTLPLVQSAVDDDRHRYSPSPSLRRATAVRSPLTPPPAVRRPIHAPTPPSSSRRAWESLRTPASRPGDVPPPSPAAAGTPSDTQRTCQQAEVSADLLPEPDYLYRRFVDESMTQETTSKTDDVDNTETSIHDILDGYHTDDNIDDD